MRRPRPTCPQRQPARGPGGAVRRLPTTASALMSGNCTPGTPNVPEEGAGGAAGCPSGGAMKGPPGFRKGPPPPPRPEGAPPPPGMKAGMGALVVVVTRVVVVARVVVGALAAPKLVRACIDASASGDACGVS